MSEASSTSTVGPAELQTAKKQQKKERALVADLSAELGRVTDGVDKSLGGADQRERAWAKERRLQLRQLTAKVTDASVPLEERMRLLQGALVAEVEARIAGEQRALASNQRAAAAKQQADLDVAKANEAAAHARGLAVKLEALCRQLQDQLRASKDSAGLMERRCSVMEQQASTQHQAVLLRKNEDLSKANEALQEQIGALVERLASYQEHLKAIDAIKEQMQEQTQAFAAVDNLKQEVTRQAEEHTLLARQLEAKQQEVLDLQEALGKAKKARPGPEALRAVHVIDMQDELGRRSKLEFERQTAEYAASARKANTLIEEMGKAQRVVPALVQRNKELVAALEARLAEAETLRSGLRRAEAQRGQLEGLCRELRRANGGAIATDAVAAAASDSQETLQSAARGEPLAAPGTSGTTAVPAEAAKGPAKDRPGIAQDEGECGAAGDAPSAAARGDGSGSSGEAAAACSAGGGSHEGGPSTQLQERPEVDAVPTATSDSSAVADES